METMKVIDGLPENYFEIVEGLRTGVVLLDNDDSYYYLNVAARDIPEPLIS